MVADAVSRVSRGKRFWAILDQEDWRKKRKEPRKAGHAVTRWAHGSPHSRAVRVRSAVLPVQVGATVANLSAIRRATLRSGPLFEGTKTATVANESILQATKVAQKLSSES